MRTKKIHFLRTTVTIFVISFVLGRLLIAQESEGPRGAWFERDRAYPDSVISSDGILDALEHQETMISTNGYYLNGYYQGIQRMWRSIGPTPVEGPTTGRV